MMMSDTIWARSAADELGEQQLAMFGPLLAQRFWLSAFLGSQRALKRCFCGAGIGAVTCFILNDGSVGELETLPLPLVLPLSD